ncbi:transcriptional regulator family: Fungal Specific TF [Penicillium roqueforti]|nr:transcriptional regulator family: Fungal Specific TF [Penicillium roqueforti]
MKRRQVSGVVTPGPKRQSRQDPVSCESCRKKKLKCDRELPCSSCSSRKLECSYGSYASGTTPVRPMSQTDRRPMLDDRVSEPPRTLQWTPRQDTETQSRNGNEPLLTADWLETIVMGHRIPSAVPATLRAEISQREPERSPSQQNNTPGDRLPPMCERLASRENPATIHLQSYLPPLAEALSLFRYYCKYLDFQYHVIIPSRVERQIETIYERVERNESINLAHTALLFSITAAALYYQLLIESSEHAEQFSQDSTFLAGAALIQSNYIPYPSLEGLQATMIIGHHLSNMNLPSSVSPLFVHRSFVSQATSMGLHIVDCPRVITERLANGFDKTNVELKRRLWWDLATYDWLIGFLSGPQEWTYSIQPKHMVVNEPLNIEDEEINHSEHGVPLSTPTAMSYSLCRLKLAVVCRQIVDETSYYHFHGQEAPYEKILELDQKLHKVRAEIPGFFRYDQASQREFSVVYRERPTLAWQRALVQQGYHSRLCRLHRHYFVRGAKDSKYSYSHIVSLQSARKVLELKRIMDEEEPVFTPHSSIIWAVMHHVFMAAAILLIDVCFNWDDILAEKRKEEVLDACRMLSRAQQYSPMAREGIKAMMEILRRHWKHERRVSSRDLQELSASSNPNLTTANASQPDIPTPVSLGSKSITFPPEIPNVQSTMYPSQDALLSPLPLEDIWTEMLESSANVELNAPDWTDLLTELTNVTLPSE